MAITEGEGPTLTEEMLGGSDEVQVASLVSPITRTATGVLKRKSATDFTVKRRRKPDEPEGETDPAAPVEVEPPPDFDPMYPTALDPDEIADEITLPGDKEIVPEEAAPVAEGEVQLPGPVSPEKMDDLLKAREEELGEPAMAPSPTAAQREAGVKVGAANTTMIKDDDSLRATIQAFASQASDYKSRSIQSLYDEAKKRGVPASAMKAMLGGKKITANIGDDELATQLAGLMMMHDASASRLDELMTKMVVGELDDIGQFELREAIAQHEIIFSQLTNAKRDVARTMNVFKRVERRDMAAIAEVRSALDQEGGSDQLRALAEKYMQPGLDQAQKNKLLNRAWGWRVYDAAVYAAQSVLLSNPVTHLYNIGSGAAFTGMDMTERAIAIPVGVARQRMAKIFGKDYDKDRYSMDDFYARSTGFFSGLGDAWVLMGRALRESEGAKEVSRNPFRAEYLFGREISKARGDGVLKRGFGSAIDAMGTLYSIAFKALSVGDELIGGTVARMQLHEEAARVARKTYDEAIETKSPEEAMNAARDAAERLLTERPADVQQNIDDLRKSITLMSDADLETTSGRAMWRAQKAMNNPMVKPILMFNKTLLNIYSESTARIPVLNFVSPKFYSEWKKGGRSRDLAVSRMALGTGLLGGAYYFASQGRISGAGPTDRNEQSNWRQLGWQASSIVLNKDEYTYESVRKLKKLMGEDAVTIGRGQFDGQLFISLKRLEPVNTPFLLAAAAFDVMNNSEYSDKEMDERVMNAAIASLAEYSSNIPALTSVTQIMGSINTRSEDSAEKLFSVLQTIGKQYSNFVANATPVANLANSSLAAAIERVIDPDVSDVSVNAEQDKAIYDLEFEDGSYSRRAVDVFVETYNRFRSRIPGSPLGKVEPRLDEIGEPIEYETSLAARLVPAHVRMGKRNKLRELFAQVNHWPSTPRKEVNGVRLPSEVQNRFKELYAKRVEINGENMQEHLLRIFEEETSYYESSGVSAKIGDLQKKLDAAVAKYRIIARKRMFGDFKEDPETRLYEFRDSPLDGPSYGFADTKIEYPDLARRMQMNKNAFQRYGK